MVPFLRRSFCTLIPPNRLPHLHDEAVDAHVTAGKLPAHVVHGLAQLLGCIVSSLLLSLPGGVEGFVFGRTWFVSQQPHAGEGFVVVGISWAFYSKSHRIC